MRRRTTLASLVAFLGVLAPGAVAAAGAPAGAATRIEGPDVSSFQHPGGASIAWSKVRASGRTFAIVKATEGTSYVNPYFAHDYAGVRRAGMVRGSYHFARPATPVASSALAQARFYARHLPTTRASRTLPPTLDLEVDGGLSRPRLIAWAQEFLLDLRQLTGRTPMIYTYPWFWEHTLGDPAALSRWPLWMATYHGAVTPAATLWQYTASARVSGIRGGVDMSRLVADSATWGALSDGRLAQPWPAAAPGAPQQLRAQAGDQRATVSWLPGDAGSTAITGYRVVASPGGATVSVGAGTTTAVVPGLTNGQSYTFTVTARNGIGAGVASSPTAPVVPATPTLLDVSLPAAVDSGRSVALRAVLTRGDTNAPIAGAAIAVWTRRHATEDAWTRLASLASDADGRVATTLTLARSTDVRIRYSAPPGLRSATVVDTVLVRALVTAAMSHPRVRHGSPSYLFGYVTPAHQGVRVTRQALVHGHWQSWQTTTTSSTGRYQFRIVAKAPGRFVYRVVSAAAHGLARGTSRQVAFRAT